MSTGVITFMVFGGIAIAAWALRAAAPITRRVRAYWRELEEERVNDSIEAEARRQRYMEEDRRLPPLQRSLGAYERYERTGENQ